MNNRNRNEFLVVLTTLPEEKVAEELAPHLLEEKLAACCSLLYIKPVPFTGGKIKSMMTKKWLS